MAMYNTFSSASDEEVWREENKALRAEFEANPANKGKTYKPTSKWWETPKKVTFANQRQPAKTQATTSPYGYSQAFAGDREDKVIGTSPFDTAARNVERLRAQRGAQEVAAAGARGSTYQPKRGETVTQEMVYEGERPELKLPEYDEQKIKAYRAKIAGPAMRRLRSELRRALSASYENPNVRRHILRGALEGYGIGLGSISAEAERAAGSRYAQEYGQEYQRALTTYNASLQAYLATGKRITKTGYGAETSEGPGVYRPAPWGGGLVWSRT